MRTLYDCRRPRPLALALAVSSLVCGCSTVKMTGTSRSGTEQLLLSGAWDSALTHVDFHALSGQKVFLDADPVAIVDKGYVISTIRRSMAEQGVLLENAKDKADVIVEAAFGAYGTDERDAKSGLPAVGVMPSLLGPSVVSGGSGSSITFSQTLRQDAVVKAVMFGYEAKTGRLLWESGPLLSAQGVRDHFVLTSGPYRLSSLPEVEKYPDESQRRTTKRLWHKFSGR